MLTSMSKLGIFIISLMMTSATLVQAASNDEALAAITARNNQFRDAVIAQDAAAAAAIYHNDVIFQAPDIQTLRGVPSVQYYLQQQMNGGVVDVQLTTEEIRPLREQGPEGKLQYEEIGTNLLTVNIGGGQTVQIPGKYIVIWDFGHGLNTPPKVLRDAFSFSVPLK